MRQLASPYALLFRAPACLLALLLALGLGTGPALAVGSGGEPGAAPAEADENATGPFLYRFEPLYAPVISKRRIRGYAEIVVTLEVPTKEAEHLVHSRLLPLRDRFMRELQFQADMRREDERAIDLMRIKARFKVLANRLLGAGTVNDVLIESALHRGN